MGSAATSFEMQLKLLLQQATMAHPHQPEELLSRADKGLQSSHSAKKVECSAR